MQRLNKTLVNLQYERKESIGTKQSKRKKTFERYTTINRLMVSTVNNCIRYIYMTIDYSVFILRELQNRVAFIIVLLLVLLRLPKKNEMK